MLDHALQHALKQGIFAWEVVQEPTLAQACPVCNGLKRKATRTNLTDEFGCRIKDALS
jgi:hypothetical protein